MRCKRGDVVLTHFPDSNLRTLKRRPALVVQLDRLGSGLPQTIVAMISTNPARAGHPSRVLVETSTPQGAASGLQRDSVIMTDNLATVEDRYIIQVIGYLPDMTEVDSALRHTLGL